MSVPTLYITNITRDPSKKVLSFIGDEGLPVLTVHPYTTETIYVRDAQFDDTFLETLATFLERSYVSVLMDTTTLTAADIRSLKHRDLSEIEGIVEPHQLVDAVQHTVSGLTSGHVLTALSATTFGFQAPETPLDAQVVRILADGTGDYATVTAALAAITDETSTKHYVLELGPGSHAGGFTLRRYFHLRSVDGFGVDKSTVVTAAAGATVTMPHVDCTITGICIRTTSATATDSAVKVVDDGGGASVTSEAMILRSTVESTAGAYGLHVENLPADTNVVCAFVSVDAVGGGTAAYVDNGGLFLLIGGLGSSTSDVGVDVLNGGVCLVGGSASVLADTAAGLAVRVNASMFASMDGILSGFDGVEATNGSTVFLPQAVSLDGFPNAPVVTDITSILLLGDVRLEQSGGGPPWTGWTVLGPTYRLWTSTWGQGTLVAADQRPTGIPSGYNFFATDAGIGGAAGTGVNLTWNGAAWVDSAGNVIP